MELGKTIEHNFILKEDLVVLSNVVVTGTRTEKKVTDSPVMVNVIGRETLDDVQACNLSEGLKFQARAQG